MAVAKVKLGEVCEKIGSGATPRGGDASYISHGISLVRSQNVLDFIFSKDGLAHITEVQAKELSNVELKERDVLVNITGDSVARVCQIPSQYLPARVNQHVAILRPDKSKLNPEYLMYCLLQPSNKESLLTYSSSGATRKALTKGMLEGFEIDLPDLHTQTRIASILSTLDDKIELNRQMNHTLEQMAQALFKKYFVDFDFPDENGKPYNSSGGEMVEDESGLMPKVCVTKNVYELGQFINGAAYKNMYFSTAKDALPVVKIVELKYGITPTTKFTNTNLGEKYRIRNGDILFSWSGSPETSIDTFLWVHGSAWLNQHIFKIETESVEMRTYVYFLLKDIKPTFIEIAKNKQTTGLGHVTIADLKNIWIAFPPLLALSSFSSLVTPLLNSIQNNLEQINNLSIIRDALLPKLMKGEVNVEQTEATT